MEKEDTTEMTIGEEEIMKEVAGKKTGEEVKVKTTAEKKGEALTSDGGEDPSRKEEDDPSQRESMIEGTNLKKIGSIFAKSS